MKNWNTDNNKLKAKPLNDPFEGLDYLIQIIIKNDGYKVLIADSRFALLYYLFEDDIPGVESQEVGRYNITLNLSRFADTTKVIAEITKKLIDNIDNYKEMKKTMRGDDEGNER